MKYRSGKEGVNNLRVFHPLCRPSLTAFFIASGFSLVLKKPFLFPHANTSRLILNLSLTKSHDNPPLYSACISSQGRIEFSNHDLCFFLSNPEIFFVLCIPNGEQERQYFRFDILRSFPSILTQFGNDSLHFSHCGITHYAPIFQNYHHQLSYSAINWRPRWESHPLNLHRQCSDSSLHLLGRQSDRCCPCLNLIPNQVIC